eukprot:g13811.t2
MRAKSFWSSLTMYPRSPSPQREQEQPAEEAAPPMTKEEQKRNDKFQDNIKKVSNSLAQLHAARRAVAVAFAACAARRRALGSLALAICSKAERLSQSEGAAESVQKTLEESERRRTKSSSVGLAPAAAATLREIWRAGGRGSYFASNRRVAGSVELIVSSWKKPSDLLRYLRVNTASSDWEEPNAALRSSRCARSRGERSLPAGSAPEVERGEGPDPLRYMGPVASDRWTSRCLSLDTF